ncbi:T9SS type A sorting domain-containing protein [candidate division WOR-3 bacterium]|nr:T9SS type A sorting domain-containing protein [candidate division WOR-3 bacterium]
MSLLFMLLTAVPLPTLEQSMLIQKQERVDQALSMPGDYWDEGHDFDVLDYNIDMTVDIPADTIWAEVTITLQALSDTLDTLPLNFHWIYTIESVKEGTRDLVWTPVMIDKFKVALGRDVQAGETLSLTISYHGKPVQNGQGLMIDAVVTYTNCEPQGARNWIPCYDEPSDKATFTQRLTVPRDYQLVANGTLESLEKNGNWWTYTWQEHYPQPTYLIAFAASKYYVTKDTFATVDAIEVPMRTWVLAVNDVRDKFDCTPGIVEYFSDIFPPYPFADEKYDQVHAPIGGAMENTTCTFFNTYSGWGDNWSWVIAHELSHHWWGDWLTCATWADLWLNEGFATYCEVLWWEKAYGQEGYDAYARWIMDLYLEYGQRHPIYDPPWGDLFGTTTYKKGGSVMHMMRQVLGDSVFFAGLKEYGWRNANEAVITDDFQEAMEEVAAQDLDWFFDEWIYGPGHPHYEIGWAPVPLRGIPIITRSLRSAHKDITPATHLSQKSTPVYEIEFAIAQTQDQKVHYFPFRMPLEVAIYSGNDTTLFPFIDSIGYQRFTVQVQGEPDNFKLDPADKVLCEITYHDDIDDVPEVCIEESKIARTHPLLLEADGIFTDLLYVRFSRQDSRSVRLALYDVSGRQVKLFYEGSSKEFYRVYPLSDLSAGVYFVRLEQASGSYTSVKTVKIR